MCCLWCHHRVTYRWCQYFRRQRGCPCRVRRWRRPSGTVQQQIATYSAKDITGDVESEMGGMKRTRPLKRIQTRTLLFVAVVGSIMGPSFSPTYSRIPVRARLLHVQMRDAAHGPCGHQDDAQLRGALQDLYEVSAVLGCCDEQIERLVCGVVRAADCVPDKELLSNLLPLPAPVH